MSDDAFDGRLDQLAKVLSVVSTVSDNHELQVRAFDWIMGNAAIPAAPAAPAQTPALPADSGTPAKPKKSTTAKASGGAKKSAAVSQDKSVTLSPAGKTAWSDFAAAKAPRNIEEKITTAVYWLLEEADQAPATINKVLYLFVVVGWTAGNDPKNRVSVAGNRGYLLTSDLQDLQLTDFGRKLVFTDLPHASKK